MSGKNPNTGPSSVQPSSTLMRGIGAGADFISAGLGIGNSLVGAAADRQAGQFEAAQYELSAKFSDMQAEDEIRAGEEAVADLERNKRLDRGQVKARAAAGGVDVTSGSAARAEQDIEFFSGIDAATIRDMAWQRAYGARVQSQDYVYRGMRARSVARDRAAQRVLGAAAEGMRVASRGGLLVDEANPHKKRVKDDHDPLGLANSVSETIKKRKKRSRSGTLGTDSGPRTYEA